MLIIDIEFVRVESFFSLLESFENIVRNKSNKFLITIYNPINYMENRSRSAGAAGWLFAELSFWAADVLEESTGCVVRAL